MIGSWVDRDDGAGVTIQTDCEWTKNQAFINRSFAVVIGDEVDMAGMQIIGWDPAQKKIRSWVFDSDGGFGEGTWTKKNNAWHIQTSGVAPDGSKTSAVNIISKMDDNSFGWQSINRMAAGELLPNVDEVVVVRQDIDE